MSTLKSDNSDLTINADGSGKNIKFQSNGSEVASIDQAGSLVLSGNLTSLGIDDNATSTAITIDSSENVTIEAAGSANYNATAKVLKTASSLHTAFLVKTTSTGGHQAALELESNATTIKLSTSGNGIMDISSGGTVITSVTTDGLTFNGDTAAANALDDYEEGTWTPTFSDINGFGSTSSLVNGTYTKIGNVVTLSCSFYLTGVTSNITTADGVTINNLPFTQNSNSVTDCSFECGWNYNNNTVVTGRTVGAGTTSIRFRVNSIVGSGGRHGGRFQVSGHYYTDS